MTSIPKFKMALQKYAKSGGARYQKVDLHVHAPTPDDYEYKGADALEQLGNVIQANDYSIVALLEHENFPNPEKLKQLQKFCPSTTILPGVEINVFVDVLDKKVSKDHFFHCLVIADRNVSMGLRQLRYEISVAR